MSNQFRLRRAEESDYQAIKDLIFNSTNDWYQKTLKRMSLEVILTHAVFYRGI